MNLRELTNMEFQEFIDNYPLKSFYQTPEYGFVMNAQNYDTLFLGLVDPSFHVVAATLVLIQKLKGFKYAYAPRGLLVDYENKELLNLFTDELKKYLGKKDVTALKISPRVILKIHDVNKNITDENAHAASIFENLQSLGYYHFGYNRYFEAMKPRFEAIINLDSPYYLLFQNMSKSFRTKIRSAVKNGVQIYKGRKEDLSYLYLHTKKKYPRDLKYFQDCYNFFDKKGKIDFYYAKLNTQIYLKEVQQSYEYWEQESILINQKIMNSRGKSSQKSIARKIEIDQRYEQAKKDLVFATKYLREHPEGITIASVLITKSQKEVYLMMDGYDSSFKRFNAKHLLIWKMIEKYSKEHYQTLNLGGAVDPNNPGAFKGLNDFKLGFHSNIYEYLGDFEIITNPTLYFLYRNIPVKGLFKR